MEYSFGLAADRRACPGEDIATTLVRAQDEDGALTDEWFGFFMVLLMVAGSDTTRNAARGAGPSRSISAPCGLRPRGGTRRAAATSCA